MASARAFPAYNENLPQPRTTPALCVMKMMIIIITISPLSNILCYNINVPDRCVVFDKMHTIDIPAGFNVDTQMKLQKLRAHYVQGQKLTSPSLPHYVAQMQSKHLPSGEIPPLCGEATHNEVGAGDPSGCAQCAHKQTETHTMCGPINKQKHIQCALTNKQKHTYDVR